ncbi:hypothetical protein [Prevotella aurantiaca]|uniref:hypothetical protein n=1 Tax=Prevotella aurantiaca TaxID=596085 RepID=UPI0028DC08EB|nr:hypothetical protein [Prevotella aurantiaca]
MERRTLSITGYGIYVVSIASLKRFLSIKNVKSKNILQVFQNNPDLYFESLSEGIWIPILPIDCIDYDIMVGSDEIAQGNWKNVFAYDGFNLDVEDGEIWIGSIGSFANFKVSEFKKAASDRLSYQTLDGETLNKGFRISLEKGKYSVSISGHKQHTNDDKTIYGYGFDFQKTAEFAGYNDPREDEKYTFNLPLYP